MQSKPETEDKFAKEVKKEPAERQISEDADDVPKIDCSEEVDEFTEFLNEFEDELKPKAPKVVVKFDEFTLTYFRRKLCGILFNATFLHSVKISGFFCCSDFT